MPNAYAQAIETIANAAEWRSRALTAEAEVERLRAALPTCPCGKPADHINEPESSRDWACRVPDPAALPVLPDVGPVTRLMSGVLSVGDDYRWHDLSVDLHEESALRELAAVRAARAFLDAEAADTSSDDEGLPDPDDLDEIVTALNEEFGSPSQNVMWAEVVREIDAHRAARTSEEQNRG